MPATKRLLSTLRPMDAVSILFLLLLSLANLVFSTRVSEWWLLILLDLGMGSGILYIVYVSSARPNAFLDFLCDWYPAPVTLVVFKELYLMVHPINPHDYDAVFIAIDRWIFGVDPTRWLEQWTSPVLTEVMQFSYAMFYFIFLIVGTELYKKARMEEFQYGMFLVLYGFYLSYVVYFIFPAVGPRFTLHVFGETNTDLPGLFLTNALREIVNTAESIPRNAANPVDFAQRDLFPSGHTQLTLVVMLLAYQFRLKSRRVVLVIGILLIFSTVYLRYHYVADVIAGFFFMLITIWTGPRLFRWWNGKRESFRPVASE